MTGLKPSLQGGITSVHGDQGRGAYWVFEQLPQGLSSFMKIRHRNSLKKTGSQKKDRTTCRPAICVGWVRQYFHDLQKWLALVHGNTCRLGALRTTGQATGDLPGKFHFDNPGTGLQYQKQATSPSRKPETENVRLFMSLSHKDWVKKGIVVHLICL